MRGYVYVISAGETRHKIGKANDPEVRLTALKSASANELSLVHSVEVAAALRVEAKAHQILAGKRVRGEWFDCTAEEAIAAVNEAASQHPVTESGLATDVADMANEGLALTLSQIAGMLVALSWERPAAMGPDDYPFPLILMEAAKRLIRYADD